MSDTFFVAGEPRIEARFEPADGEAIGAVVVCHPHPLYGGDMDNYVVVALSGRLRSSGLSVLRFNFRGTGSSGGSHDGKAEVEDVQRALEWVRDNGGVGDRMGLAGYSFGAMVAAGAASGARAFVAVSPPAPGPLPDVATLLIVGGEDQYAPPEAWQPSVDAARDARLVRIAGTDHFWGRGLREMADEAAEFFIEELRGG
ncbi:MAG: alpha/beta fold hydrolase [Dehalococcoidia bacterium]